MKFIDRLDKVRDRRNPSWQTFSAWPKRCGTSILSLALLTLAFGNASAFPSDRAIKAGSNTRAGVWLEQGTRKLNVDTSGMILKGYDPVAYFTKKQAVKGSAKYQATYQGATYYFSSAADLAVFKTNPAKYVPQYGGFCANGMKNRRADNIDPTVFFVVNGKLYLCTSPSAEKEFRLHEKENIKKADLNWDEEDRWFY